MDNARKNRWRRQEFIKVREQRVIAGYVEKKYPGVYKEAGEFYKFLNDKYPTKKDLRRTNEYEWIKTGISGETTRKFYKRNKRTTTAEEHGDNMQLVIPLMTHTTTTTTTETSQSTSATVIGTSNFEPSVNEEQPLAETSVNEEQPLAEISVNEEQPLAETSVNEEQPLAETSVNEEQPLVEPAATVIGTSSFEPSVNEEIPDRIIKEIMANLQQDPYLEDFFSTIDIEFDETSPLERELAL